MLTWLATRPDFFATLVNRFPIFIRVLFGLVLTLAVLATWSRYQHKIAEPSRDGTYTKSAILRWRPQIEGLMRGENIYELYEYPNPPIMALILQPLTLLAPFTEADVWFLLKLGMAALIFRWVFRLVIQGEQSLNLGAKMLVIGLALHPLFGDLSHGNVNIFIACLLFGSLELIRQRRDALGGVVLALAMACKVTPILFVPFFLWKCWLAGLEAWRHQQSRPSALWQGGGKLLAGVVFGLLLWLVVVPGSLLGFTRNTELFQSWFRHMVQPFVVEGKVTSEHPNQSIPGVVHRLLTHEPSDLMYDEDGKPVPNEYANLADIGPEKARWIVRGTQAVFVLFLFVLCRTTLLGPRQGLRWGAECAVVMLGMLLFSERTWKHHATTTALPMAVFVGSWAYTTLPHHRRVFLGASLILCLVLMTVPSFLNEKLQDRCMVYGTHTLGFLVLLVNLGVVLWTTRSRSTQFA